jgi:hypothetical protein
MITGELRNQVDRIWDAFWFGGIANPLEVIDQITDLLFLRRLDDVQALEESKAARLKLHIEYRISNQIEFINLIVDHLAELGVMAPQLLYESPFTDISPRGPEGVFPSDKVDEIITLLNEISEKVAV